MLLSLQASPVNDPEKQSLQYFISRINDQRGGFRNVSELSLEEEIKAGGGDKAILEDDESSDSDQEVEDTRTKKERVSKAREEMLKQIGQAQNESAMALDFISLLLSSRTPGPAALTLSPFIKQNLPLGCLGVETVQIAEASVVQKDQDEMIAMGWRMQSLNNAADSLLKSASRLESEIQKETTYWDQVLAIKAKGWALSRLPRERHTLGVHYGFSEAHQSFRDRGLAALRRDENGALRLDRGSKSIDSRLRIRKLVNGQSQMSRNDFDYGDGENTSLEQEILAARNSIYDEELFHELHREAQHLANQGVKCVNSAILLPFGKECQFELMLDAHGESELVETLDHDSSPDITILALRLLLSLAHQQNLHERAQIPPPVRQGQRTRTTYPILKPLVEFLNHRSHLASIDQLLCSFQGCMRKAGLPFEFRLSPFSCNLDATSDASSHSVPVRMLSTWALATSLTSNTIELNILDHADPLIIKLQTAISPPNFGTSYKILQGNEPSSDVIISCSSPQDLECEVSHLLEDATKQYIKANMATWHDAEIGVSLISRQNHDSKARETIFLSIAKDQLYSIWCTNDDLGQQQQKWSWYSDDDRDGETQPLHVVLEKLHGA